VADIGKSGACAASGGKTEPGHVAKYHCLMGTSARGFLSGADTIRGLDEEYRCFNPNGLKYRTYFYDWDRGHRYILNLRENEVYTRYYQSLGKTAAYYVANGGQDPEAANPRYHIRGNGVRTFKPVLQRDGFQNSAHSFSNITALDDGDLAPATAGQTGEVIFKVEGANVITGLKLHGEVSRRTSADSVRIAISTINGLGWKEVWQSDQLGAQPIDLQLTNQVNGAYEVLVKVSMVAPGNSSDVRLTDIAFETTTMLNSKTQPKLNLGKNTIYVGAGEQTESIVFWPDLQGDHYKPYLWEEKNITSAAKHAGYMGVMHATKSREPAYVVFKMDAPRDITRLNYGGRLYNRAPGSRIDFLHSFDGGKNWTQAYSLTNTSEPWDVIHYETVERVPPGTRSVLFKYLLQGPGAASDACSLYAVRMEANHKPAASGFQPMQVTFNWSERQEDYSLVERSHTERITQLPHRYNINVGGADHPVVNWLRVNPSGSVEEGKLGYSDGKDVGGDKFISKWVSYGTNLARGKPYAVSVPSSSQWGAGDPDGTKLTDGVVGPPYPGANAPSFALCWDKGRQPEITVDLGQSQACGAFRIQLGAGWPWWDALRGQMKDKVEVLSSIDGKSYTSHGLVNLNLRWKDLPVNHFWPDEEVIAAHNFELVPAKAAQARYVRFKVTPERTVTVSEVQVLDSIRYEPFDLRLTLPEERQLRSKK
jgi:hypothetical protein